MLLSILEFQCISELLQKKLRQCYRQNNHLTKIFSFSSVFSTALKNIFAIIYMLFPVLFVFYLAYAIGCIVTDKKVYMVYIRFHSNYFVIIFMRNV